MASGGQERVDLVAMLSEQIVPAKPAVVLGMADHGLDGGSSLELAFHSGGEAALASGEHDLGRPLVVVALIALVRVGALDLGLGLIDSGFEGVAIVRISLEGLVACAVSLPTLAQTRSTP